MILFVLCRPILVTFLLCILTADENILYKMILHKQCYCDIVIFVLTQTGWLLSSTHFGTYDICINTGKSVIICIGQIMYTLLNRITMWDNRHFVCHILKYNTKFAYIVFFCFLFFFHFLLVLDCELFVFEILQDENLSIGAQESREILQRNFLVIQKR